MNYLLDKKLKRKKLSYATLGVVLLVLLFCFSTPVSHGLSYISHTIFRPVLILGNNISQKLSNAKYYFASKRALLVENENLKLQISESQADRANYASVVDENLNLQEILGRKSVNKNILIATILAKPNRSPYDTLLIDVGMNQGVIANQRVFAFGNIPIGKIAEAYANSSKVLMYSNSGEKTEVIVVGRDTYLQAVGRGGGNFEIILPKDFNLDNGTEIVLPGITSYVLGVVVKTISDPRDAFVKALIASPVNIQSLKFVEVER